MAKIIKRYFGPAQDGEERFNDLKKILGIGGGLWPDLEKGFTFGIVGSFYAAARDYQDYQKSGRYPFGDGNRYSQPQWLLDNFQTLKLLEEYFALYAKYGPKAVGDNIPRSKDIFGA